MNIVTIPKMIKSKEELVLIPRKEYEALKAHQIKEVTLTPGQRQALIESRKELKSGKLLSYEYVANKLGFKN